MAIELNEKNVLRIYNDCLIDGNQSNIDFSDLLPTKIFTKASCGKDSPEIIFSKSKIKQYSSEIEYLYGQLHFVHHGAEELYPKTAFYTYSGKAWTKNNATLMAFFYLGVANITITPFSIHPSYNDLYTDLFAIEPTLSPNDPNYKNKI